MHKYIALQPFTQGYDLVYHIFYVMCVNLIRSKNSRYFQYFQKAFIYQYCPF